MTLTLPKSVFALTADNLHRSICVADLGPHQAFTSNHLEELAQRDPIRFRLGAHYRPSFIAVRRLHDTSDMADSRLERRLLLLHRSGYHSRCASCSVEVPRSCRTDSAILATGYHRYWAHRSYNASLPLQYFLAMGGSGAVEGSIRWWSRGHRAHHRYTDTDLDPYSAHKGFLWSHVGWMIFKPRRAIGFADISDLNKSAVVRWQHRFYLPLIVGMGFVVPTVVAGLLWGDWRGGFFFAGAARLLFVHHSTFCVNSLAHWLGDAPFDDKHTPRDHFITALVTVGEGYHNL